MPKYRVVYEIQEYEEILVEAENEEQAVERADGMEGKMYIADSCLHSITLLE